MLPQKSILKRSFIIVLLLVLIAPVFLGYIVRWTNPQLFENLVISIYGIYSITNFIIQVITANINNHRIRKDVETREPNWQDLKVGILVVGYREDPFMFKKCLESIRNSTYSNIARRICVIDGNDYEDTYLADIYSELYQATVVKLDKTLSDYEDPSTIDYAPFGNVSEDICVMQPHKGKREALYTGFKIFMNDPTIDAIITTDSDTILDQEAVLEMLYQLRHEDVGAVAGQIGVWNTDTLLTFIVSLRYWYSFNLERACDSFFRCVMCVAGPMGCYKVSVLNEVLEPWLKQTFLGIKCTYGDDRHLTNTILSTGHRVIYTEHAIGYTDTPMTYSAYINQQTRWGKSYFREIFFTMKAIERQHIWIGWELFYHTFYFFLLLFWTIMLIWFTSIRTMAFAMIIMTGFGVLKSVYGFVIMREIRFLYFHLYAYIYYFVIVPSKIAALLTMRDGGWGTRGKYLSSLSNNLNKIVAALWVGVLGGAVGYAIYKNPKFAWHDPDYRFAFISLMSYLGFFTLSILSYLLCQHLGKFDNEAFKKLREDFYKNNAYLKDITVH